MRFDSDALVDRKVGWDELRNCETSLSMGPIAKKDLWPMGSSPDKLIGFYKPFLFIAVVPNASMSCFLSFTFVPALLTHLVTVSSYNIWISNSASCSQLVTTHNNITPTTAKRKVFLFFSFPSPTRETVSDCFVSLFSF